MTTRYQFKVLSQGASSWSNLESLSEGLEELLNSLAAIDLQNQGFELWQTQVLNDRQGNNGFMLLFRRPLSGRTS